MSAAGLSAVPAAKSADQSVHSPVLVSWSETRPSSSLSLHEPAVSQSLAWPSQRAIAPGYTSGLVSSQSVASALVPLGASQASVVLPASP